MKTDREQVKEFYNAHAAGEWKRIGDRPEFLLTCRFLDKYVGPGQSVLDIGGGPGRYSIRLAGRGCRVTLLDLAEENVRLAKENAAAAGVKIEAVSGDGTEADRVLAEKGLLPAGGFDAVLLMGPLYHLLEETERVEAVRAALRCLRTGGLLFASFILTTGDLIDIMKLTERTLLEDSPEEKSFLAALLRGESWSGNAFTRAHLSDVSDIEPFMERFPLEKIAIFGQEGVMSPCENRIMATSPEEIEEWLRFSEALAVRREYWGFSEHLMYIGRKKD